MEAVVKVESSQPGPTVALFGGVHGNETVGVLAMQHLAQELDLERGTAYLVLANPPAIQAGERELGKNLNRCFVAGNSGGALEDVRARELMRLLDGCDGLLDIHAYRDPAGEPFVICEPNALEIARQFRVPLISTNWSATEPGAADGYMYEQGKIGICLEAGPTVKARETLPVALDAAQKFLAYFGMIGAVESTGPTVKQRLIEAQKAFIRTSDDYELDRGLKSFQRLSDGQVYGNHAGEQFVAAEGECIIFPRPDAAIGTEAFVIGVENEDL